MKRVKFLQEILQKHSGRDNRGRVAVRHQGGRQKRFYRKIDWLREKEGILARVISVEYDPNRTSEVALLQYADGEKRYIIAPQGLKIGQRVTSGAGSDLKVGNALPLKSIPVGTLIHNIEIKPGKGAQMVRSAGSFATIVAVDEKNAQVKLSSGELRLFNAKNYATIGQIGNADWKNREVGLAGRNRRLGRRPTVRGVAQNPRTHPHGGGEGRSGIGLPSPKSPWGKRTLGTRTRKRTKYSDRFILQRRKGKHGSK